MKPIFQSFLYADRPVMTDLRIYPLRVLYAWEFYPGRAITELLPSEQDVRALARTLGHSGIGYACVNLEHWPVTGMDEIVAASVANYVQVLEWLRSEVPHLRLGVYGRTVLRDWYRPVYNDRVSPTYLAWQNENARLQDIVTASDFLAPSLYTLYREADLPGEWKRFAEDTLHQCRRWGQGKPVYPFLWPQYHPAGKPVEIRKTWITGSDWRPQLELIHDIADGMVLWGIDDPWDESSGWWGETKDFLAAT